MSTTSEQSHVVDGAELRRVCAHFTTGVAVITSGTPGRSEGTTVNSFTSVSLDPPLVLFCLHRGSRLYPVVRESGGFVVNLLARHQETTARAFAGRASAVVEDVAHRTSSHALPILSDGLAFLVCRLAGEYDGGDHAIVLGEVIELGAPGPVDDPLVFYRGALRGLGDPRATGS